MARQKELARVTVPPPADLYERIRAQTDNVSAFVSETLALRLRKERLIAALDHTCGLMAETFQDLQTPKDVLTFLQRERAGWKRAPVASWIHPSSSSTSGAAGPRQDHSNGS